MTSSARLSTDRHAPVFQSLEHQWFEDVESAYAALNPIGAVKYFRSLAPQRELYHFSAHLPINRAHLTGFGSSELQISTEPCAMIHLAACFAGWRSVNMPLGQVTCASGGFFLLPPGEREIQGSCSNAIFTLRPQEVARAAAAMAGDREGQRGSLPRWRAFKPRSWGQGPLARQMHAIVRYIDACAAVDPALPAKLALDDVVHRQVAALLEPALLDETPADGERIGTREGRSAFDDLIDYILANLDQPLRLSDLEARSHYSRRALQYAFRQKLQSTPKQWIRQQRLHAAMEKLKGLDGAVSVQGVALRCGYRSLSLFSSDFKRQFGLSPSQVRHDHLRSGLAHPSSGQAPQAHSQLS